MPHVGFIRFEIERLAAGSANDFTNVEEVVQLLPYAGDISGCVSSSLELVRDVGKGSHQYGGSLVEGNPLRFTFLEVGLYLGVAAEIVDIFEFALGGLHRLAQER